MTEASVASGNGANSTPPVLVGIQNCNPRCVIASAIPRSLVSFSFALLTAYGGTHVMTGRLYAPNLFGGCVGSALVAQPTTSNRQMKSEMDTMCMTGNHTRLAFA